MFGRGHMVLVAGVCVCGWCWLVFRFGGCCVSVCVCALSTLHRNSVLLMVRLPRLPSLRSSKQFIALRKYLEVVRTLFVSILGLLRCRLRARDEQVLAGTSFSKRVCVWCVWCVRCVWCVGGGVPVLLCGCVACRVGGCVSVLRCGCVVAWWCGCVVVWLVACLSY